MKVFISFDMEGVAGIVDWSQCRPPGQPYEEGRRLLLGERVVVKESSPGSAR
jgi:D-amino peptidase